MRAGTGKAPNAIETASATGNNRLRQCVFIVARTPISTQNVECCTLPGADALATLLYESCVT